MIPVLSIVGKAGVGKTTLIEKLVAELNRRGWRTAVIKHHAHPTPLDPPAKDTARYANAGAAVVLIASPIELARFERLAQPLTLRELAARINDVDLILAEGFSGEPGAKLEVSRAARGTLLIADPNDLVAVAADHPVALQVPRFAPDNIAGIADFICERMLSSGKNKR